MKQDKTAQERGRIFEKTFAKLLGAKPQKGSGSLWFAKLDIADGVILWSLKLTDKKSFSLKKSLMREVDQAIHGQGGIGGDVIPGVAVSVDGEEYVVLRAQDFLGLVTEGVKYAPMDKAESKRARAGIPAILRESDEELPPQRGPKYTAKDFG